MFLGGILSDNLKERGLFPDRHRCEDNIETGCVKLVWKVWPVLV